MTDKNSCEVVHLECPLRKDFAKFEREWRRMQSQMNTTTEYAEKLLENSIPAQSLDKLTAAITDSKEGITRSMTEVKDALIKPAVDKTPYVVIIALLLVLCAILGLKSTNKDIIVDKSGVRTETAK